MIGCWMVRDAVSGARIAPTFEVMRFRQMPTRRSGSFIVVRAKVDGICHLAYG